MSGIVGQIGARSGVVSGYVLKPNIPSWYVTNSTSGSAFSANSTANWDQTDTTADSTQRFAQGGCTISSGIVTVPVTGLYHIHAQILSNQSGQILYHLRINDVQVKGSAIEGVPVTNYFQSCSSDVIQELSANDNVRVEMAAAPGYGSSFANFLGYLIG